VRALAITGPKRSPAFPNIPTLTESGLTGFDISPWFGLLGPAGMPEAVVKKINADVNEIVHDKDVQAKFAAEGAEPYTTTPQEFSHVLQADIVKWAQVVKASGARID
jgi:tripartite-type tricarboxylate transporter receptor subunit TctC